MKYIVSILLSALLAYAVGIYGNLPWWSFVVTNFIIAFAIPIKPAHSFTAGALGVGSLWAGLAFGIDMANNHILSTKVAKVLTIGDSYLLVIFMTVAIGTLLGGLASLTGSFLRNSK